MVSAKFACNIYALHAARTLVPLAFRLVSLMNYGFGRTAT
jgi:hypothetical protein